MSSIEQRLKNLRARRLGTLTNLRRRALVMVNAKGSRTKLTGLLKELDAAADCVTAAHHEYVEVIAQEEQKLTADKTYSEAIQAYEDTITKIGQHLQERKDERLSVVSETRSGASAASAESLTREAEIQLKLKQLKLERLNQQLSEEKEEEELKQKHKRQAAEAEVEAARVEVTLRKAAESGLSWERKDDFAHEEVARKEENLEPAKLDARCANEHKTSPAQGAARDPDMVPDFRRSLPRLTLRIFSGDSSEWPTWYGLFKAMVHNQKLLNPAEKMMHLQSSVSGIARQLISGMLCDPSLYPVALQTLEDRFGREQDIVQAKLNAIFSHPSPSIRTLEQFYADVNSAVTVLDRLDYTGDLNSQENLRRLVSKLPSELRREWAKHVVSFDSRVNLFDFNNWLKQQVKIGLQCMSFPDRTNSTQPTRRQSEPRVTSAFATTQSHETGCVCCGSTSHQKLWECDDFKAKNVDERAQTVASKRCCFRCLRVGHRGRECRSARTCGIQGCEYKHHQLLHGSKRVRLIGRRPGTTSVTEQLATQSPDSQHTVASFTNVSAASPTVLLQVVPVRVHGANGKTRDTLALLDPGAQTSLCCASVLRELSITGQPQPLRLRNVESDGEEKMSERVQLAVSPLADTEDRSRLICVPEAYSVTRVNVRTPTVSAKSRHKWTHLQDLDIPDCTRGEVELLLGANCLEAVLQTEARVGQRGQPTAIRTAFGWSLTGSVFGCWTGAAQDVMFIQKADQELTDALQDWWSTESFGTKLTGESLSPEDAKAMKILEETTRRLGPSYEVGLPWRDECRGMPDNHGMALLRLAALERSLKRKPEAAEGYAEVLEGYVSQGYARKVSSEEKQRKETKRWLLPHHAVVRPDKPKPRVVFDAAAEQDGVSLNTELLKGPDLLQNLCAVLLRFREEQYALVADIHQMFHQIRVRPQDQPALSFLWRGGDPKKPPDMYQMCVVIFGARCSPMIANHILRRALTENPGTGDAEVDRESLVASFYMDDYLRSEGTVEAAGAARQEVTTLLRQGGFHLTKWRSNSPQLLEDVEEEDRDVSQKNLTLAKGQPQKALGCVWSPISDTLGVRVNDVEVASTKRGVLQRTAMLFDPLGIITPFVLIAKCLTQTLWQKKLAWDEDMPDEEQATWRSWLEELSHLEDLAVPRCLKSTVTEEIHAVELHMFADASERAFAAAGYVRFTDVAGHHHSALVMARSRLAPLKQLSIVRLELQAAVLAVRLATVIRQEMSYVFERTVFWTDSQVVLQFISNESRTFRTFVANRVAEIRESSEPLDWKHVPGKQNPSDIASRGMPASQLKNCDLWWRGPEFLHKDKEEWPKTKIPGLQSEQPELKKPSAKPTVTFVGGSSQTRIVDPASYSSWNKYRRVVAWSLRFIHNLRSATEKKPKQDGVLTVDELQEAERLIFREDQAGRALDTPTGLSLCRDDHGLVRAQGRLSSAPMAEISREPIVLHPSSEVTRLIVTDLHVRSMHTGLSQTLNQFRYRFWTPKARSTVRRILWACARCRNRRAQPVCPKMAALPAARVEMDVPFASCGLDFLGPLTVRKFRKAEKRYILLVTCLATRAIHLEVAHGLDTDSFLMALRRFIGRRGRPRCIYSDNGTNLVGGERELREALSEWNQQKIHETLTQENIVWRFNPPTASHMGGAWERLVASVKRALRAVLGNQTVSDDVLHTTVVEVEYVINSRPLTYVSGAGGDPESITPNHFLLVGGTASASGLPPGIFEDSDTTRKRWRHVQVLTNQVWRRWLREYLPTLISRKKWNKEKPNFAADDVVLVMTEDTPRGYWPLGVVQETYPSADGIVRSVLVRTPTGLYKRPSNKLCVLERSSSQ